MRIQKVESKKFFDKIVSLLYEARQNVARNVNNTIVHTYYEIGRMIIENEQKGNRRAEYGKQVLVELSAHLTRNFGRGYSVDNLQNMRNFYLVYSRSIVPQITDGRRQVLDKKGIVKYETPSRKSKKAVKTPKYETLSRKSPLPDFQLSWSHYLKLMRIENLAERRFYEIESAANNWSLRELKRQYDSALYQRLALSRDKKGIKKLSEKGQIIERPQDALKDPYVLEFIGLPIHERYSESDLEQQLIDKIEHFMLELGKGFTFGGRQVRMTIDEKHFHVDLVFYNRFLRSFVLIDLKIGELTHQDIGQMQMYVNYYDRFVRLKEENKTIGIILCQDKSETLVNITLPETNKQIFTSKYQTVLPSKEQLQKLIENK